MSRVGEGPISGFELRPMGEPPRTEERSLPAMRRDSIEDADRIDPVDQGRNPTCLGFIRSIGIVFCAGLAAFCNWIGSLFSGNGE